MTDRSYVMALTTVQTKTKSINKLELRLLNISAEKTMKHSEGSAKISEYTSQMSFLTEQQRKALGDDYSSEEYKQCIAKVESIENEYMTIIQGIRDQMQTVEDKLDTNQETVQTELEAERAERDKWKELANKKAESCGYFKGGSA